MKDLKIGTQLRIGLGFILFFVVLLGVVSWYQANILWKQTDGLYNHPLKVRVCIGNLKNDILLINRSMKEIVLLNDPKAIEAELTAISVNEADAYREIDSVSGAYLGPHSDIEEISKRIAAYSSNRAITLSILHDGNRAEAINRTSHEGPGGTEVDRILKEINDVSDFASARADKFYHNAQESRTSLQQFLLLLLVLILILSFLISVIVINGIKSPLMKILKATDAYAEGNYKSRIEYSSKNELGRLASSFNRLAEVNTSQIRNKEVVGRVADVMLKEEELHSFCHSLIMRLLEATNSQIGAIYLLNVQKTDFLPFESIGLNPSGSLPFSATSFEGEFGIAISSRKIHVLRDIPADTAMVFRTASGDFRPREIVCIPISSGDEVVAIVSLATLNVYPEESIRIINDIHITLIARFNGVLGNQKIIDYSSKLELQNRELDERSRELAIQGNELTEQNIELEMQKQQLDEANRLKSSFLSNMSHELRTPLNSVIALSGVLSRRLKTTIPDEEFSYIEIIERNGKNLLSLINDILDLSRIESGHEDITADTFNVFDVVEEVVLMLEPLAVDKNIELLNTVSRDLHPMRSDYVKCRHILQNLIGNAIKFTGQGKVEVNAAIIDNEIRISVADTGIGISEAELPYIFDEFRQADEGSSRKYGGTGLGLAIAKKFAVLLQGGIEVKSQPGKGTTFILILPLRLDTTLLAEGEPGISQYRPRQKQAVSGEPVAGAGRNILLVEDSEPAIIQIKEILAEKQFSVFVTRNGKEALDHIKIFKPDAIILDLMMPEVDGFQVLKMIRELPETSLIPVLILTAKQITKEELSFLKGNNIHQFIQKGDISRLELLSTVDEMVRSKPGKIHKIKSGKPRKNRSETPRVLVVEDNPDNMKTIKALLSPDNLVMEAIDGAEGVSQAMKHKPDLILMDLSLPVMDGFSAFKEIRKSEDLREIPIIAITASAMKGSREEVLESGFDDYISKPIDEPLFRRVLDYYLNGDENNTSDK